MAATAVIIAPIDKRRATSCKKRMRVPSLESESVYIAH
jgi:hypothetical protein